MGKLKGGFGGFGAEAERRPAESNEIYALIRRATGYISDYIGALIDPELAPRVRAKIHCSLGVCADGPYGKRSTTTSVIEKLSEAVDRGLWQEPDPELITQLQQIYLDVEGDLEDI